jgi:DNA-binding MarR family transcriptional regulator
MFARNLWLSAEELLTTLPLMNSLIAIKLRQEIDAEITLVQFRVLDQLQNRSITLTELAEQRGVTRQSASLQVQGLVERGWVRRMPDPDDRRQYMLEVTDEGRMQVQQVRKSLTKYLAHLLEMLTPDEFAALQIVIPAMDRIITLSAEMRSMMLKEQQ